MKCKSCKNEIPEGSVFCMYCGERLTRKKKSSTEIKVPKPVQLPSGAWRIQLRAEGQSVTKATPELCITKAKAIRAGFVEQKAKAPHLTLDSAIQKYISNNDAVLSPATLRGYEIIRRNRFPEYMALDISSIDWQKAINKESRTCSPKTVKNAWGLVSTVMRSNGLDVPNVHLPSVQREELSWLTYEQIGTFLSAIRDKPCEFASLFALHSLRRSELMIISPSKIVNGKIVVRGSVVPGIDGKFQVKETNKTRTSTRTIPIVIPRLEELIMESTAQSDEPYIKEHPNSIYKQINSVCKKEGLPEVGLHGLRRSFASLAYHIGWSERETMAIGGWSDWKTMHDFYIKLSDSDISDAAMKMRGIYENFSQS